MPEAAPSRRCTHTHTHTHTRTRTCSHTCPHTHTDMHTCKNRYADTCKHTCMHTHTCAHTHVYTQAHARRTPPKCIHMCTYPPTHSTHPYRAHTHTPTHAAHTCARPHFALLQLPSPHYRKKSQAAELRTSGRHPRSCPRPCGDLGPRLLPGRASRAETTRLAQGSLNPTGAAPGAPSFREAVAGLRVRPGEQHPHFSRSRGERESGPPDSR